MCPSCNGLGTRDEVDPELVVPDRKKSIREGAIAPWASAMARGEGWTARIVEGVARAFKVDLDTPWSKLPEAKRKLVLYGANGKRIAVRWGKEGTLRPRHVGHEVRGRHPDARAALPRDGVGGDARAVPAIRARAAVRRVRRQAPAAARASRSACRARASPR